MKTELLDACYVAYIRVTGPYGENYELASNQLYQWAVENGLQNGQCLFIYRDNPDVTPADECRTDLCLTVPEGTVVGEGIKMMALPGGNYATIRGTVTEKSQYRQFWQSLLSQVDTAGLEHDDRPCFELYHSYDPETYVADVSFYTAIKG